MLSGENFKIHSKKCSVYLVLKLPGDFFLYIGFFMLDKSSQKISSFLALK